MQRLLVLLVIASFVLVACGSGDSANSNTPSGGNAANSASSQTPQ